MGKFGIQGLERIDKLINNRYIDITLFNKLNEIIDKVNILIQREEEKLNRT